MSASIVSLIMVPNILSAPHPPEAPMYQQNHLLPQEVHKVLGDDHSLYSHPFLSGILLYLYSTSLNCSQVGLCLLCLNWIIDYSVEEP